MPKLLGDVVDHQEDPTQKLRSEAFSNLELSLASHMVFLNVWSLSPTATLRSKGWGHCHFPFG